MDATESRSRVDQGYYDMLFELQTMDFTLLELSLYLSTHPFDRQAIQQYNQMAQKRRPFVEQFEARYGPLLHGSYSKVPWQWLETPWPWQV